MTHGCLRIVLRGESREVFLHTYNSGQFIPKVVLAAPAKAALVRFSFLVKPGMPKLRNKAALRSSLEDQAAFDALTWPPAVAAWIIASSPNLLEPTPPEFVKDLPEWSAADDPYLLELCEKRWRFFSQGVARPRIIKPKQIIVDAVWGALQAAKEGRTP